MCSGEDVLFPSEGTWHSTVNNDDGLGAQYFRTEPRPLT